MSGVQDDQGPSSVCDDEECNLKYQNGKYVPIFREEAY
jgi:hypothetical protein